MKFVFPRKIVSFIEQELDVDWRNLIKRSEKQYETNNRNGWRRIFDGA
jgi:hypothetical protein